MKKYALTCVLLILLINAIIATFGGYTQYNYTATLDFVETSPGHYVQIPDPDYPIENTESFRFPWEDEVTMTYKLPPSDILPGGIFYLPAGNFTIENCIWVESGHIYGAGANQTIIRWEGE